MISFELTGERFSSKHVGRLSETRNSQRRSDEVRGHHELLVPVQGLNNSQNEEYVLPEVQESSWMIFSEAGQTSTQNYTAESVREPKARRKSASTSASFSRVELDTVTTKQGLQKAGEPGDSAVETLGSQRKKTGKPHRTELVEW